MDLQEACEKIWKIEQEHDVNLYIAHGVHIWPIARMVLWKIFNRFNQNGLTPLDLNPSGDRLRKIVKFFAGPIWYIFQDYRISKCCKNKADVLFLSPEQYYTETIDGKRYSRIIDPFFELVRERFSTLKLSYSTPGVEKKYPSINLRFPSNFVSPDTQTRKIIKELSLLLSKLVGVRSDYLLSLIEQAFVEVYFFREKFIPILNQISPKMLIQTCYYAPHNMGALWAASELGIPSVDVQHGKQGQFQGMFSYWGKIPNGGYAVLPTEFWNWGEKSAEHIMRWQPDRSTHKAVAVGFPWLEKTKCLLGTKTKPLGWPAGKKVVLITMQERIDSNGPIPEFLVQIIKELDGFFWLLRPHFNAPETEKYAKQISANFSSEVVNVNDAMSFSVYQILEWSDYHLTSYSSVCYEAGFYNVPTGIISSIGLKMYKDEIENGIFNPAFNKQQLKEFLLNPTIQKNEYFLSNSNEQIVNECLRFQNS